MFDLFASLDSASNGAQYVGRDDDVGKIFNIINSKSPLWHGSLAGEWEFWKAMLGRSIQPYYSDAIQWVPIKM